MGGENSSGRERESTIAHRPFSSPFSSLGFFRFSYLYPRAPTESTVMTLFHQISRQRLKETCIRLYRGRLCQDGENSSGREREKSKKGEVKSARTGKTPARRSQRAKSRRVVESGEGESRKKGKRRKRAKKGERETDQGRFWGVDKV